MAGYFELALVGFLLKVVKKRVRGGLLFKFDYAFNRSYETK
jgi:hypothetical protein